MWRQVSALMIAKSFSPLVRIFCAAGLLLNIASRATEPDAAAERDTCRKNLATLHNAIQAYRLDNKDLPEWLSDLVPKYLKDPNALTCPVARRTGRINNHGIDDPKISTGYVYEFADTPIPKSITGGDGHTMEEWKRRQMGLIGGKVPMVRCHLHTPQLNLSFDGAVFESEGAWENGIPEVNPAELMPTRIFSSEAVAAARSKLQIPTRSSRARPNLIDLSSHYNASLSESWHPNNGSSLANDLAFLPRGLQKFGDIEFDTRGLIQLSSRQLNQARFPLNVKGIKVDQKATRLHFLHSTGWSASEGTPMASFVIHYANNKTQEFTLQYGVHAIDWVHDGSPRDTGTMEAWKGKSPANDSQAVLHIYKTMWNNPEPGELITTIDYVSANLDPAHFLIAITAENP